MIISGPKFTLVPDYGTNLDNAQFAALVEELKKLCGNSIEVRPNDMQPLEECDGHVLVVFGKAAMLTGGIKNRAVLYINPEYETEGDWAELFESDRAKAVEYYRAHTTGDEPMAYVLPDGTYIKGGFREPRRYGIFTTWDRYARGHEEFEGRYPRHAMVDTSLDGNAEALAKFINDFADKQTRLPLDDIKESLHEFPRRDIDDDVICRFEEPVATVFGYAEDVEYDRSPEAILTGETVKVRCAETGLCAFSEFVCRQDLEALSDAIATERKTLIKEGVDPFARPHILLIPDYSASAQSAPIRELQLQLQTHCGETAVYYAGSELEKSRLGVERVCKRMKFDLILTIGSGCLLATRVTNAIRIFIDPDWAASDEMKMRLGEDESRDERRGAPGEQVMPLHGHYKLDKFEIAEACRMAERYNIKHGNNLACGWFTLMGTDQGLPEEHMKRFNSTYCPSRISVDDEEGVARLCKQINGFLSGIDDDESK